MKRIFKLLTIMMISLLVIACGQKKESGKIKVTTTLNYYTNLIEEIIKIVLRKQKDFFITEGKKMNVLKISELASELDLSSSTISRAIKEKYIKSDFGIISLRKLFNLSSTIFLCQEKIAEYIENEDREKPYSDQDIVKLLENDGIKIARRTVSKYRIDLGYKPSSERKRSFQLLLNSKIL